MDAVKALEPHLECPICLSVPRVMLMCVNSHDVCSACLKKLGPGAKCPMGRCDFANPPAINRTVARLVESFPFKWPCKYQYEADCKFKGTWSALESHETACWKEWISSIDLLIKESRNKFEVRRLLQYRAWVGRLHGHLLD